MITEDLILYKYLHEFLCDFEFLLTSVLLMEKPSFAIQRNCMDVTFFSCGMNNRIRTDFSPLFSIYFKLCRLDTYCF